MKMSPNVEIANISPPCEGKSTIKVTDEMNKIGVAEPGPNDVLCGRGGNINTHPGNEAFRKMIESNKRVYLTARFKKDKRLITDSIIDEIKNRGGNFLIRDQESGLWVQVGQDKARDKTSQALRENAPKIRYAIEKENEAARKTMIQDEQLMKVQDCNPAARIGNANQSNLNQQMYPNFKSEYQTEWASNSPKENHYYHNHNQISPDNNSSGTTPRYNKTKSFMETMADAFVCPTSLNDIYPKTKPYYGSQNNSHHYFYNKTTDYNQCSLGQKRSYYTSGSPYQRRDDSEHWENQNKYYEQPKSPLYYRLPGNGHQYAPTNPHIDQGNPKRTKGSTYSIPTYPKQSQEAYPNRFNWSPFSTSYGNSSNKEFIPLNIALSQEEGQEVQLVERIESMSMDCDDYNHNQLQMDHHYRDRNQTLQDYDGASEVRTPPPVDEERYNSSEYDWILNVGGCHNIFCTNLFDLTSNEDEQKVQLLEVEKQISKVPSVDMDGSLASLETTGQFSASDLNGPSLVNVFSEGDNAASTKNVSGTSIFPDSLSSLPFGDSITGPPFIDSINSDAIQS